MADLGIKALTKAFGPNRVLRGVTLDVPSGRLVAILGGSGSGKTTLLRLLCGFEHADSGTIRIAGQIVSGPGQHVPPEQRHIGYVAQEGALFPHLCVADNIVFGLPRRLRRARHRVAELLELVGLSPDFAQRPPHQLSGGEQQRVALARALAPEPTLVLLDEPFSALDAALRIETRQAVAAALLAAGATALLVTHDQSEALSMGNEVGVLRQGALVQVASPETLYRRPVDADLARFVGEAVLLPGVAGHGSVTCSLGRLPLAAGMPEGIVEVLIRPEQIRLTAIAEIDAGDATTIRARVREVDYYGHDASVKLLLLKSEPPRMFTARVPGHMAPHPGEEVVVFVRGEVVSYARSSASGEGESEPAPRSLRA
jgi:iron(III) transport system ATP-binding protein